MPVTVLVRAPARIVSAALIEVRTLRQALARGGLVLDSAVSGGVLAPGDEVRLIGRLRATLRLVDAEADAVRAELTGHPSGGRFTATCETALGLPGETRLTCGLSGCADGDEVVRSLVDVVVVRAPRLAEAAVVVGAAIVRAGRLLAQQRDYPAEVAGRWELAGGRVEPGETDVQAVRRECEEELGVLVEPGEPIGPDIVLGGGQLLLRVYQASLVGDTEPTALEHRGVRWLAADELDTVDWLPADRVLVPALRRLLA